MPPKANATETCPGCDSKFTPSGLSHHLSQTKKPACVAIRESHPELAGGLAPQFAHVNFDAPPVPFQGDYYGDYSAQDFDDPMEALPSPSPTPSDSGSESGDDEFSAEVEQTVWEPPTQPTITPSSPLPPTSRQHPTPLEGPAIPTAAEREAAERQTRRNTFIVRLKASTAGAPIRMGTGNVGAKVSASSYKSYGEQVGDGTKDNPYHPFSTRMEWEVARWAKLRGSGSTAFSDLLAIEGVCLHRRLKALYHSTEYVPSYRLPKRSD